MTKAYMLSRWTRRLSRKETAEAFRTSWDKVFDAVEHVLTFGLERRVHPFGIFTVIGDGLASKIVFGCSDMWEPHLKVIREKCSEAPHILDRFTSWRK
jgi:transposase